MLISPSRCRTKVFEGTASGEFGMSIPAYVTMFWISLFSILSNLQGNGPGQVLVYVVIQNSRNPPRLQFIRHHTRLVAVPHG